jgi:hypothetical protein
VRSPMVKSLLATFRNLTPQQAKLIKKLAKLTDNANELRELIAKECPDTDRYARSCYSDPFNSHMWRVTMALHAIDRILGTHGVESLGEGSGLGHAPPYEYCNTGDTYAATLIYRRASDNLFIGDWGSIVERNPDL